MDLNWSDDEIEFRARARAWLADHVPKHKRPDEGPEVRAYDLDWQRSQFEGGWAGIQWPKAHGGLGLSALKQYIWHEECARANAPDIGVGFVGINHAGPILIQCGDATQQATYLPPILRGETVWCQGFSEPGAGSDLSNISTSGRVEGDALIVNGEKIWSSYAQYADYQELLLRTDPGSRRTQGLTWAICDMHAPGITIRPIRQLDGRPEFCSILYDEVRIPLVNVVGGLGNGWSVAMSTLSLERGTAFTADQERLAVRVEALIEHAQRVVSRAGPRMIDDESVAERLGMLRAEIAALRALSLQGISRINRGAAIGAEGSMVKLYLSLVSQRTAQLSMQMLGADSLYRSDDGPEWVNHYLRSYQTSVGAGTNEIQHEIIAERLLGLPRAR
jgi:alkylation response protein AidB-like acyl-CoA dehydrogenase